MLEQRDDRAIHLSMLEVYQDKVFDLLSFRRENLHIRDNGGAVEVAKLSQHAVASMGDVTRLVEVAATRRSKSNTSLNAGSSRSHAVYSIRVCQADDEVEDSAVSAVSTFQVVDLAGAERGSRTRCNLAQQREANNINTSLMQLWRCINAMKRRPVDASVVPFRENKLTHILMPHLGRLGLAGTAMLTCVNPHIDDYDETISVLGNASLACSIREIVDVRANLRMSALAVERAVERANNKEAKAVLLEGKKRRAEGSAIIPPTKYAREGNKPTGKRASEISESSSSTNHADEATIRLLQEEIAGLKAVNKALIAEQYIKESQIRQEVSTELEQRGALLLNEVSELQQELLKLRRDKRNDTDVMKSCKKARRWQVALAVEGASTETLAAEEELELMSHSHALQISQLKAEKLQADLELNNWRSKAEAAWAEIERMKQAPGALFSTSNLQPFATGAGNPSGRHHDIPRFHYNSFRNIQSANEARRKVQKCSNNKKKPETQSSH